MANYYYGMMSNRYDDIRHYRTKGSKNGVRRYQNEDGSLTPLGRRHYGIQARLQFKIGVGIKPKKQNTPPYSHGNSHTKITGPSPSTAKRNDPPYSHGSKPQKILSPAQQAQEAARKEWQSKPKRPARTGIREIDVARDAIYLAKSAAKAAAPSIKKDIDEIKNMPGNFIRGIQEERERTRLEAEDPNSDQNRLQRRYRERQEKRSAAYEKAETAKRAMDKIYGKLYKKYNASYKKNWADYVFTDFGPAAKLIRIRQQIENDPEYKRAKKAYGKARNDYENI